MAKAVLVMDMPECCADCQLADDDPSGLYCVPADDYYDGSDSSEDRASFCPLQELPDKKCGAWTDGMITAYNKYLSEVLERKE